MENWTGSYIIFYPLFCYLLQKIWCMWSQLCSTNMIVRILQDKIWNLQHYLNWLTRLFSPSGNCSSFTFFFSLDKTTNFSCKYTKQFQTHVYDTLPCLNTSQWIRAVSQYDLVRPATMKLNTSNTSILVNAFIYHFLLIVFAAYYIKAANSAGAPVLSVFSAQWFFMDKWISSSNYK